MPRWRIEVWIVLVLGAAHTTNAQWLKQPTPGLVRTADGTVDLSAPAPRTNDGEPDLSGVWGWQPGRYLFSVGVDLTPSDIRDWARELTSTPRQRLGKDDPNFRCLPQGPRMNLYAPIPVKIVQTPTLVLILSDELTYRQIFLDGRTLPKDPEPSFMGYSVGHWDATRSSSRRSDSRTARGSISADAEGIVTHLLVQLVEGDLKAMRGQ